MNFGFIAEYIYIKDLNSNGFCGTTQIILVNQPKKMKELERALNQNDLMIQERGRSILVHTYLNFAHNSS